MNDNKNITKDSVLIDLIVPQNNMNPKIFEDVDNTHIDSSKIAASSQVEGKIARTNSPTFQRLLTARAKLVKYFDSIPHTISAGQHVMDETSSQSMRVSLSSRKQTKCQSGGIKGPCDEKTWLFDSNMRQKLSLEIWLPKVDLDYDDGYTDRATATTEVNMIEKNFESITTTDSRRLNCDNIVTTTTIPSTESKSHHEISSKTSEPVIALGERPRSNARTTMVKSNDNISMTNIRYPRTFHRSISTNYNDETLNFETLETSTSTKNLSVTAKSNNSTMINEVMQKYASMHKNDSTCTNNHLCQVRLPLVLGSTTISSSNHPETSVKTRSVNHRINNNTKLLERCSTINQSSPSNIYPRLRMFCLANQQQQHLQQHSSSSTVLPASLLSNFSGMKIHDPFRSLQRRKTFDTVSDTSMVSDVPIHSNHPLSNAFQSTINETLEQMPCLVSRRSIFTPRSKQQHQNNSTVLQKSHSPSKANI